MTTGSKYLPQTSSYVAKTPYGNVTLTRGRTYTKSWSGGNSKPSLLEALPASAEYFRYEKTAGGKVRRAYKRALGPNGYLCNISVQGSTVGWAAKSSGSILTPYAIGSQAVNPQHVPVDASHDWKAIDKLRKKLFGSGFHPGIFLAEMPKTLNMIALAATRMHWALWGLRHGDLKVLLSNLGNLSDSQVRRITSAYGRWQAGKLSMSGLWLEAYYGWKPLLSDMEAGAKYIAYALTKTSVAQNSITGKRKWSTTRVDNPAYGSYGFTTATTNGIIKYKVDNITHSPWGVPSLPALAGTAWEVIPYSFVFDWAIPIASYLDALRTANDVSGRVTKTTYLVTDFSDMQLGSGWNTPITWVDPMMTPSLRLVQVKREVLARITPQGLAIPGSIGEVFSCWQRAASAVSLLTQRHALSKYRAGIHI